MNKLTPALRLKKYGYLVFLLTPLIPLAAVYAGRHFSAPDLAGWLPVLYFFALVPIADALIGRDNSNPDDAQNTVLAEDRWYPFLVALCVPAMTALLVWGGYVFSHSGMSWVGQLGWIISIGSISGVLAINAAHELIHKPSRAQRLAGGYLLSLVCYAGFKVEHIRGHHVHVATPEDNSSAQRNQTIYNFLLRALARNVINAWRLEAQRLRYRNLPALHWRNELIGWYALIVIIAAAFWLWLGLAGVVYFFAQSLAAVMFLETVNYLEHYGLQRRKLPDGRYERTTHLHSWNSNFVLTNLLLFQLQRHSDHHANPARPYQLLRHFDDSPQLPAGYATMMLMTLIPGLWRRVMNRRLDAFYSAR